MTKNLVIRYSIQEVPESGEIGEFDFIVTSICSSVTAETLPSGSWKVKSSDSSACRLWIGIGETRTEAIAEFIKARLGRGYSWTTASAVLRGDLRLEDFATNLGLTPEEAASIIQEQKAELLIDQ